VQELLASESSADSVLECFVLLVDFSELLLSVVFCYVCYVNQRCLKKGLCHFWISVVTDFDLLALDFQLFDQRKFGFLLFALNLNWLFFFLL
jgi:hypothetical protein